MKNIIIALFLIITSCGTKLKQNTKQNFDFGWKFYAGEVDGAEQVAFNDATWREVNLPHDWSIEGKFSKDHPSFSRGGWLPTGKVVYRKTFEVSSAQKGQRFVINFDGAYRNSEVYINGHLLGKRPMGYIAFHYNMTPYIKLGENVITVKLDNSNQPGSRWYTGTGIYRHVHLIITDKVFVPVWGNYIVADDYNKQNASIKIETTVENTFSKNEKVVVLHKAYAPNGTLVSQKESEVLVASHQKEIAKISLDISNPMLWNPKEPNLYTIETNLVVNNAVVYSEKNKTGIRKLEFSKDFGFKINGKITKLKGACLHHAGGPLGAAVHRRTIERQLEKLREMGCNAVRTAHNPFSEEFMNVCDEMGFLVMNEMFDEWERPKQPATVQNGKKKKLQVNLYAHHFKEWADRDLTDFVLKDRNHPSVIMWSIGNEIDQMRDETGVAIGKRLANIVHQLDYRPVTNGVHGYWSAKRPNQNAAATSDIYGFNYIKKDRLDKEKAAYDMMGIITEHESVQSFYPRATYLYGKEKQAWWDALNYKYKDAYNWVEKRDIRGEAGMEAWQLVKEKDYLMGMFIWTGWDYLGEVIPFGWPARSSSFAPIDLAGFPKDGYYYYQSQWADKPMVHIFPHWNLKGMEGKTVQVYGYTNGDEVELFQDGKSLGKQKNNADGVHYQTWNVTYQPGELKVVSYQDGKVIAEKMLKTAGKPTKIKAITRRNKMKANGQDVIYVECTLLDKDGNEVPTANNLLTFHVKGAATIAGVANGNNMGLEPFKANKHSAFNGKCLVILQSTQKAGVIDLSVSSKGLETTKVSLRSK